MCKNIFKNFAFQTFPTFSEGIAVSGKHCILFCGALKYVEQLVK